jgi:hypothetical protein
VSNNVPPNIPLQLNLQSQQVLMIIDGLNHLPHGQVRETLDSIVDQANEQLRKYAEEQAAAEQSAVVQHEATQE